MLFARISTEIMFPGHMGGEKPGNEDLSTEISDDTLLKCQGLWLEFTAVVHYTLAAGLCKHVFFIYLVKLYACCYMYQFP